MKSILKNIGIVLTLLLFGVLAFAPKAYEVFFYEDKAALLNDAVLEGHYIAAKERIEVYDSSLLLKVSVEGLMPNVNSVYVIASCYSFTSDTNKMHHIDLLKSLSSKDINWNNNYSSIKLDRGNIGGQTPMHGLFLHHRKIIYTDGSQISPARAAFAIQEKIEVLRTLIKLGATINFLDDYQRTPLDLAMNEYSYDKKTKITGIHPIYSDHLNESDTMFFQFIQEARKLGARTSKELGKAAF